MTRNIETIVAAHKIASARRAAGKPSWDRTIRIKHLLSTETSNTACVKAADKIHSALTRNVPSSWVEFGNDDFDWELNDILEGFELMDESDEPEGKLVDSLNGILSDLYNWADLNRVWLS